MVVAALRVAKPLTVVQQREGIDGAIEVVHQVWLDRPLEDQIAPWIEEKVIELGWLPRLHCSRLPRSTCVHASPLPGLRRVPLRQRTCAPAKTASPYVISRRPPDA